MLPFSCPFQNEVLNQESCQKHQEHNDRPECLTCSRCYRNHETYKLYKTLLLQDDILGKLTYHMKGDYIHWQFHDLLFLDITTEAHGYGYIEVNDGKLSIRPYVEEILKNLLEIGRGDVVFVTKIGLTGRYISGMFPRALFEAKKKKITFGIRPISVSAKGIENNDPNH